MRNTLTPLVEGSIVTVAREKCRWEIKERQTIMDHLRGLPVRRQAPTIPVDERAAHGLEIKVGESGIDGIESNYTAMSE